MYEVKLIKGPSMIKWINVNSKIMSRIAYNSEVKTMYIDFKDSTVDTPYAGVNKALFKSFCEADNIDEYFETFIKNKCKKVEIDIENTVNIRL